MDELLKKWDEYCEYLAEHGEVPQTYGNYYTFYWFMLWLKHGKLPGKRFN